PREWNGLPSGTTPHRARVSDEGVYAAPVRGPAWPPGGGTVAFGHQDESRRTADLAREFEKSRGRTLFLTPSRPAPVGCRAFAPGARGRLRRRAARPAAPTVGPRRLPGRPNRRLHSPAVALQSCKVP